MWFFIFALITILVFAVIFLYIKIQKIRSDYKKELDKQIEIQKRQDYMLSQMGQDIRKIAKNSATQTDELVKHVTDSEISTNITKIIKSKNNLLNVTNTLIEFLRLKSKKTEVANTELDFINLINEITGILTVIDKKTDVELIYNIDHNISKTIIGDTLNLSKIVVNLLEYSIQANTNQILLNVYIEKNSNLIFRINTNIKKELSKETQNDFFNTYFNDEEQEFSNLLLFVAKEISILLDSKLTVQNNVYKDIEFVLSVPYKHPQNYEKLNNIQLPKKIITKKVLLIAINTNTIMIIKEIFKSLHIDIKTLEKSEFFTNTPNFKKYDLLIIDEQILASDILKNFNIKSNLKIISLKNIFDISQNNQLANITIKKPLTINLIYDTLIQIYSDNQDNRHINSELPIVHKEIFQDTPNIRLETFSMFRDSNVLLVEDNLINQKILHSMLSKSGINLTIVSNGIEAVDIIKNKNTNYFNLVLMDINMPIMDGYEASKIIREDTKYNQIPIISLTTLTSTDEINKILKSGMNGFLAKPIYKEKLFTVFTIFIAKVDPNKFRAKKKDRRVKSIPVKHDRRVAKNDRRTQHTKLDFSTLKGLDVEKGLAQNSGNTIFYTEVLKEFKDAYSNSDEVFKQLVQDQRFEQLRMLCIDMKGLSEAIGATDIHNLSLEILQRLLFKKYELIPTFVDRYKDKINTLNESIDTYIKHAIN